MIITYGMTVQIFRTVCWFLGLFKPKYGGLFGTKPSSIATFGIRYQNAVKALKLHPENIAKFQFP